jgi:hypothetical protein
MKITTRVLQSLLVTVLFQFGFLSAASAQANTPQIGFGVDYYDPAAQMYMTDQVDVY